jgi:glycopeptide antibiotics resistance protein
MMFGVLCTMLYLLPSKRLPSVHFDFFLPLDKVVHFLMFFLWTIFQIVGFKKQIQFESVRIHGDVYVVLGLSIVSFVLEFLQGYFSLDRIFELQDIFSNLLGIMCGYLVFKLLYVVKTK